MGKLKIYCGCICQLTPRGGTLQSSIRAGMLRPKLQPLILLYTTLTEKVPLLYT